MHVVLLNNEWMNEWVLLTKISWLYSALFRSCEWICCYTHRWAYRYSNYLNRNNFWVTNFSSVVFKVLALSCLSCSWHVAGFWVGQNKTKLHFPFLVGIFLPQFQIHSRFTNPHCAGVYTHTHTQKHNRISRKTNVLKSSIHYKHNFLIIFLKSPNSLPVHVYIWIFLMS